MRSQRTIRPRTQSTRSSSGGRGSVIPADADIYFAEADVIARSKDAQSLYKYTHLNANQTVQLY